MLKRLFGVTSLRGYGYFHYARLHNTSFFLNPSGKYPIKVFVFYSDN